MRELHNMDRRGSARGRPRACAHAELGDPGPPSASGGRRALLGVSWECAEPCVSSSCADTAEDGVGLPFHGRGGACLMRWVEVNCPHEPGSAFGRMSTTLLQDRQRNPASPSVPAWSSSPRSAKCCLMVWTSMASAFVSSIPRSTFRLLSRVSTMPALAVFSVSIISFRAFATAWSTYVVSAFRMTMSVSALRWFIISISSLRFTTSEPMMALSALCMWRCWIWFAWLCTTLYSS
mmetsp:Transcript_72587/g.122167  ORF Transcript_72587/g.122167 Transcript_72587/m.122167 type:complete len:235 (+) Transcript_72587:2864-3568(+)